MKKDVQAEVKESLVTATTLTFHHEPIAVSVDASSFGIRSVILHKEDNQLKPLEFATRSLVPVESRYTRIEKSVWYQFGRARSSIDFFGDGSNLSCLLPTKL